jgi:hypothetical protein
MRQALMVTLDAYGLPHAEVPFTCMWDLVEYLSYQRVGVMYDYHASHFTVTLPRMDIASAQRILDEWVHAGSFELQTACCQNLSGSVQSSDRAFPSATVIIGGHAPPERSQT